MARREEQQAMEGLLRRSFARESIGEACPDAGILAAYVERSLAADETAHYELHFSRCALCREQLAAMASISDEQAVGSPAVEKAGRRRWGFGLIWGWHSLAPAAVVMSLLLVWFIRYRVQTRTNAHPWTAPMVAMMKQEPNPATAANQPPAARGNLALSRPASALNAIPRMKKAEPAASPAPPNQAVADEARARQALGIEKDRTVEGGTAGGGFAPPPPARNSAGPVADAKSASPTAQPSASQAMNYAPSPPPKIPAEGKPANQLDKAVAARLGGTAQNSVSVSGQESGEASAQVSDQAAGRASGNGSGQAAGGSAGAVVSPTPVEPVTTQSVTVTSASSPAAAIDKNSAASGLTDTIIGGEARVANGTGAKSATVTAETTEAQKTAETTRLKAAAETDHAAKKEYKNGQTVKESNAPSAGQSTLGTGYVLIATPDPAVFWRIAPDGFVERSQDTGATWEGTQISAQGPLLAGSAPERNVCWMVGRDGLILVTEDARRWKQLEPPVRMDIVSVTAKSGSSATIKLADGTRYETSDSGKKWRALQ